MTLDKIIIEEALRRSEEALKAVNLAHQRMFRAVQQDNQRIARSCELVEQGLERVAVLSRSGLKSTTLISVRLAPTTGARDGHSRTAAQWQKKSFTGLRKESGSAPVRCAPFVILDAGFLTDLRGA